MGDNDFTLDLRNSRVQSKKVEIVMKLKTLLLPLTASVLSGDYVKGWAHLKR